MRGDYESKVTLAKAVFKRFMKDCKMEPTLVPQLTQVVMEGRTVLIIHNHKEKKTEVYIDGTTTS
tara:strand:- start:41029 stop:41223 length:195 start_codon:yes stop_codon:yes gene_type:complete